MLNPKQKKDENMAIAKNIAITLQQITMQPLSRKQIEIFCKCIHDDINEFFNGLVKEDEHDQE